MQKRPTYISLALSLYLNYFVLGVINVLFAQNMDSLTGHLNTDPAGVAYAISGLGFGKIFTTYISGFISDKIGRKPIIYLGILFYAIFCVGSLYSTSVQMAFFFSVICGLGNSALDTGTYPGLMECFPSTPGTATLLLKAAISFGTFLLPLFISFLALHDLSWTWTFYACLIVLAVNSLWLFPQKFPPVSCNQETTVIVNDKRYKSSPRFWLEGVCLILIGFTSTITFFVVTIWLSKYGEVVAHMEHLASLRLLSFYSLGSISSVFLTAYLVRSLVRPVTIVLVYPMLSAAMIYFLYLHPTPEVCTIGAVVCGVFGGGGVLQLSLATMVEFFPRCKGRITGLIYTSSSFASFLGPAATGYLASHNIAYTILFDAIMTSVGVVLGCIVFYRYRTVIDRNVPVMV